jgi:hypothetical protein
MVCEKDRGCLQERAREMSHAYPPIEAIRQLLLLHALSNTPDKSVSRWAGQLADEAQSPNEAKVLTQLSLVTLEPSLRSEWATQRAGRALAQIAEISKLPPFTIDLDTMEFSPTQRAVFVLEGLYADSATNPQYARPELDAVFWPAATVFTVFLNDIIDQSDKVITLLDHQMFRRLLTPLLIARGNDNLADSVAEKVFASLLMDPIVADAHGARPFMEEELRRRRSVKTIKHIVTACRRNTLMSCEEAIVALQETAQKFDAAKEAANLATIVTVGKYWHMLNEAQRSWWLAAASSEVHDRFVKQIARSSRDWTMKRADKVPLLVDLAARAADPIVQLSVLNVAARYLAKTPVPEEMLAMCRRLQTHEDPRVRGYAEGLLARLEKK